MPSQGSRRSGRARLTHPVPLAMDSLPKGIRSAIRWCYVDTISKSDVSVVFPSNGTMTRRLASLHGVRADSRSPASTVLSRRYDSLSPIPPRFVAFAWRYRSGRLRFASAGGKRQTPADRDALVTRVPHTPGVSYGSDRASHVPGEPSCAYALLSDPGGTDASGHFDAPTRPPCEPRRRLPRTICLSGLNHTALALAVYASQDGLLRHHARLASG